MSFVNEAHFSWSPLNAVFTDLRYIAASKRAADLTLTQMKKFFCQQIKINEKKRARVSSISCKIKQEDQVTLEKEDRLSSCCEPWSWIRASSSCCFCQES